MAKLNKKIISLSLAGVFLLGTYFVVTSQITLKTQTNMSVFGRNVYEQNDDSNNALASNMGKKADPDYHMSFPQDHGTHDQFDIEWWYLTANLQDEAGDPYGLQWTLFRFKNSRPRSSQAEEDNSSSSLKNAPVMLNESTVSLDKKWHNDQIYMAHASIHSSDTHWFSEKFARGGVGNAGLTALPLNLFIDDWQWLNSDGDTVQSGTTVTYGQDQVGDPDGFYNYFVVNDDAEAIFMKAELASAENTDGSFFEICFGLCYDEIEIGQKFPANGSVFIGQGEQTLPGNHLGNTLANDDPRTFTFRYYQTDQAGTTELGNDFFITYSYDPALGLTDNEIGRAHV